MAHEDYGVLKGRAIARRLATETSTHYHIHIDDGTRQHRISINVRSRLAPSALDYVTVEMTDHPIVKRAAALPFGFTILPQRPNGLALDYVRGDLFDRDAMIPLPYDLPGDDNDLNEKLDTAVRTALTREDAVIYAFGNAWGPEHHDPDWVFGFLPGRGIHDIHMNQGNHPRFRHQDRVWGDGGLLINIGRLWTGVFLRFQSQSWRTDDETGHALTADSL